MNKMMLAAAMMATIGTPLATAPAIARDSHDYRWHGDRHDWRPEDNYRSGNYRARRLGRNDRIYRGHNGRYYCRRSNGTTGLVIGAVGGGLAGNLLGGGTLGALLGRSIDRGNVKCR